MDSNKLTTTNISVEKLKHLKKLSSRHHLRQVEFINAAVDYFRHTGINPIDKIYSPREEISKLAARLEQVIKFLNQHEKNKLSPLFERLLILESKLKGMLENTVKASDIEPVNNQIVSLNTKLSQMQPHVEKLTPNTLIGIKKAMDSIYQRQNKNEKLFAILFEALNNRSITGGFRENDIKRFEDALR